MDVNPANIYLFKVNNRNTRWKCTHCNTSLELHESFGLIADVDIRRYSIKKVFLKIPQNCRDQAQALELYQKRNSDTGVFCEF